MQTLLHRVLLATGHIHAVPPALCEALQQDVIRLQQNATLLGQALQTYLWDRDGGVEGAVGFHQYLYGRLAMRPGGDVDILVRKEGVLASLAILDEMGIGQYWPTLLHDRYYERHHLLQQRCTRGLKIWFELLHLGTLSPAQGLKPECFAVQSPGSRVRSR